MTDGLAIRAWRHGRVCVLAVKGELDVATAGGFAGRALAAVAEQSDLLVQDREERLPVGNPGVRERGEMTRPPGGERPWSLVVDLSGLEFIDCAGARALAGLVSVVPLAGPVLMYRAGSQVRQVLDMFGHFPGFPPGSAGGLHGRPRRKVTGESEARRLKARILRAHTRELRELVAATGEQLASTLTGLAEHRPHAADSLTTLSRAARELSVSLRQ